MDDNAQNENTDGWLSDKIIDDFIRTLLTDTDDCYQPMPGDKYKLSVHETKFINGIKKMPSASKGLKKAYKDKFISESETLTRRDGNLSLLGTFFNHSKYISITIPGVDGQFVLAIDDLKSFLKEGKYGVAFKLSDSETVFIIETINKKALLTHCIKWD